MFCPSCQTVVRGGPGFCPTCGDTMRDVSATDAVEVVEVTAAVMPGMPADVSAYNDPSRERDTTMALAVRRPTGDLAPALARAGQLALAAWRQPAVRAAVKTGTTAVALSLAVRAARQAMVPSRARRAATRTMLPSLADLMARENEPNRGDYQVVETVFYMRRVVRR